MALVARWQIPAHSKRAGGSECASACSISGSIGQLCHLALDGSQADLVGGHLPTLTSDPIQTLPPAVLLGVPITAMIIRLCCLLETQWEGGGMVLILRTSYNPQKKGKMHGANCFFQIQGLILPAVWWPQTGVSAILYASCVGLQRRQRWS